MTTKQKPFKLALCQNDLNTLVLMFRKTESGTVVTGGWCPYCNRWYPTDVLLDDPERIVDALTMPKFDRLPTT